VLVRQRTEKDIWQHLHEFLLLETMGPVAEGTLLDHFGLPAPRIFKAEKLTQKLSHQTIHFQFIQVGVNDPVHIEGYEWKERADLEGLAFPQSLKTILRKASAGRNFDYY
jgi:A/G-specific adenine glycosylase